MTSVSVEPQRSGSRGHSISSAPVPGRCRMPISVSSVRVNVQMVGPIAISSISVVSRSHGLIADSTEKQNAPREGDRGSGGCQVSFAAAQWNADLDSVLCRPLIIPVVADESSAGVR
jgi:hypothetical protein